MVESLQRVIVEDEFEDEFEFQEDEEWENIYGDDWDCSLQPNESYSAVARGHQR